MERSGLGWPPIFAQVGTYASSLDFKLLSVVEYSCNVVIVDNYIDGTALTALSEGEIKELIPQIGLRHRFMTVLKSLV